MRRPSRPARRLASALWLPLALCFGGTSPSTAAETAPPRWRRVYIDDPTAAMALRHALGNASRRLEDERCGSLLSSSELRDPSGHALTEKLASLGMKAPDYLDIVVFIDGSDARRCEEDVLAFTEAGSRIVYVCAKRFRRIWKDNSSYAEAAVIHEALHTLGLGENPPSSAAITQAVLSHCYR